MRKAKKIVFDEPIIVGGKTLKEVTMRVPKGKDLLAVSHIANNSQRDFQLISNLCDMNASLEDFEEFDGAEILLLQGELQSFLSYKPKSL